MNRAERRAQMRAQNRSRGFSRMNADQNPCSSVKTRGHYTFHIDELVLHGFPLKTRYAVSEATQIELTRLLTTSGLPNFVKNPVQSDRIDGGAFNVTQSTKPQTIGNLIANAVYGGQWR